MKALLEQLLAILEGGDLLCELHAANLIKAQLAKPESEPSDLAEDTVEYWKAYAESGQHSFDVMMVELKALRAQQVAVPPGYALVPIEPTPEMVAAYLAANLAYWQRTDELPATNPSKWRQGTPSDATAESYKAMLKAAPQAAYVPLTDSDITSMAYDCNALPEVITDETLRTFARAIEQAVRNKA